MSNQIKPSVTNPTIADIYEKIESGRLDLAPDFQRKFVWTHEHQEQFLDTILNGYPFPEIYVCQGETDIIKIRTSQKVIDGQQRLTTIRNYIENSFEKQLSIIKPFASLGDEERADFLNYQVVVRDIGKVDDDLIREIFRRINLTKFKLESIEIHNAIYDGKFIQLAKELASDIDIEPYGVFHESEFTRMADIHFFLLIMSTLKNGGYFNRDSELEKCIANYNEEFPDAKEIKDKIVTSFNIIKDLDLPNDSIWYRKSNFFTLAVELANKKYPLNGIKDKLLKLEDNIVKNRYQKDNEFGVYYGYMYAGTNNRIARVVRGEIFNKYIS